MLGVSFFVGLQAAPPSMASSIEMMDDTFNLHDYQIISTLGFEQEDIDALLDNEYINDVQPYYFLDCYTKHGKSVSVIRLEGKSKGAIDRYEIVEGRDIQAADEIVLLYPGDNEAALGDFETGLPQIGETVSVYLDKDNILDSVARCDYTVVGYYRDSKYITKMLDTSTLDAQMLGNVGIIDESNFVMEAIPSVMMTLINASSLDSFSQDYQDYIDESNSILDATFKQGEQKRSDAVIGQANDKLNDARSEYEDGLATFNQEISDAQDKINDGQSELNQAYSDLVDGDAEFAQKKQDAINELKENEQKINDGKAELAKQEEFFAQQKQEALQQLADAKHLLDTNQAQIQSQKDNLAQQLNQTIEVPILDHLIKVQLVFDWNNFPTYDAAVDSAFELAQAGNSDVDSIAISLSLFL